MSTIVQMSRMRGYRHAGLWMSCSSNYSCAATKLNACRPSTMRSHCVVTAAANAVTVVSGRATRMATTIARSTRQTTTLSDAQRAIKLIVFGGTTTTAGSPSLRWFSRYNHNWQNTLEGFLGKPRTIPVPRWITPKHSQVTFSECFGHASFVLVAISYAVDDFLLLRMIAVAGSSAMLVFTYFHPHGRVLWLPFKWNVLFIAINSYRIGMVYWNRYLAERLPDELMILRQKTFYTMDPVDYFRLMRIAEIKEYKKGDLVLAQGEQVGVVRLVLDGQLKALRNGKLNYLLEEGNFISEVGIHAGLLIPGKIESCCTIVADGDGKGGDVTRLLCWNRTELVHLMELYQGLRRTVKSIMSWDIVRKLKYQRLLLVEHLIDDAEAWTERRNEQTNHRYAAILQAVLQNPLYLQKFRKEVNKYRTIHHIDDEHHAKALEQIGWTMEEFEAGKKKRKYPRRIILLDGNDTVVGNTDVDDDDYHGADFEEVRDWKWYMQDIYLRLFG